MTSVSSLKELRIDDIRFSLSAEAFLPLFPDCAQEYEQQMRTYVYHLRNVFLDYLGMNCFLFTLDHLLVLTQPSRLSSCDLRSCHAFLLSGPSVKETAYIKNFSSVFTSASFRKFPKGIWHFLTSFAVL
jgi:hypothetical protein